MRINETNFVNEKTCLYNLEDYSAIPVTIKNDGITATDGKKIVKSGTLINKEGVKVNDETARYIVLSDVDVTADVAVGAGLYRATVKNSVLKEANGAEIATEAVKALKGIFIMTDAEENIDYKV